MKEIRESRNKERIVKIKIEFQFGTGEVLLRNITTRSQVLNFVEANGFPFTVENQRLYMFERDDEDLIEVHGCDVD